jgi:mono/diheme cytochrome c family protein
VQDQIDWVTTGKPANEQYGTRGISSGRMPHFGNTLTKEQIQAIVDYERSL